MLVLVKSQNDDQIQAEISLRESMEFAFRQKFVSCLTLMTQKLSEENEEITKLLQRSVHNQTKKLSVKYYFMILNKCINEINEEQIHMISPDFNDINVEGIDLYAVLKHLVTIDTAFFQDRNFNLELNDEESILQTFQNLENEEDKKNQQKKVKSSKSLKLIDGSYLMQVLVYGSIFAFSLFFGYGVFSLLKQKQPVDQKKKKKNK